MHALALSMHTLSVVFPTTLNTDTCLLSPTPVPYLRYADNHINAPDVAPGGGSSETGDRSPRRRHHRPGQGGLQFLRITGPQDPPEAATSTAVTAPKRRPRQDAAGM